MSLFFRSGSEEGHFIHLENFLWSINLHFLKRELVNLHKIIILFIAQKMKFSIKDFFSKCDQIRKKLRIWLRLLKKSLMETSFFVQCFRDKLKTPI